MSDENPVFTPIVRVGGDGNVFASSRDVAAYFHKRHDNVLRAYDTLDCSEGYRALNYEETMVSVSVPKGGTRQDRSINMTKDGFTFLVMKFTGKRAAKFKEDYIASYNRMEALLRQMADGERISPQGSLHLEMDMAESMDRMQRAITSELAGKIESSGKGTIGALIKSVAHPIIDAMKAEHRWMEERLHAKYRRDNMMIDGLRKVVASLERQRDADDCVTMRVAMTLMGVPEHGRNNVVTSNLTKNAMKWFALRGYTVKPDDAHSHQPWVFQRSKIQEWWQDSGLAIHQRGRKTSHNMKVV